MEKRGDEMKLKTYLKKRQFVWWLEIKRKYKSTSDGVKRLDKSIVRRSMGTREQPEDDDELRDWKKETRKGSSWQVFKRHPRLYSHPRSSFFILLQTSSISSSCLKSPWIIDAQSQHRLFSLIAAIFVIHLLGSSTWIDLNLDSSAVSSSRDL